MLKPAQIFYLQPFCQSVQAALTEKRSRVAYKKQKCVSHQSEEWKSEIKEPTPSSWEGSLLGCRQLISHYILMWWKEEEGALGFLV